MSTLGGAQSKIGGLLGRQWRPPFRGRGLTLTSATKNSASGSSALCRTMLAVQIRPRCRSLPLLSKANNRILNYLPRVVVHVDVILTICRVRHSRYFVGTQSLGEKIFDAAWQPRPPNSATAPTTPPLLTRQRLLSRFLPRPPSSFLPSTNYHRWEHCLLSQSLVQNPA